jgi:uncharacterized protein YcfJ
MKKKTYKLLLASAAGIALLGGCVSQETLNSPTVQTGAATGAVAGAVIGYNTTGHHKGRRAAIGALVGAALGGAAGSAIESQNPQPVETGGWQ